MKDITFIEKFELKLSSSYAPTCSDMPFTAFRDCSSTPFLKVNMDGSSKMCVLNEEEFEFLVSRFRQQLLAEGLLENGEGGE